MCVSVRECMFLLFQVLQSDKEEGTDEGESEDGKEVECQHSQ